MRAPVTPSSLKWLINRRARLDGELEKLQAAEDRRSTAANAEIEGARSVLNKFLDSDAYARRIFERISGVLKQDIDATDQLLRQHEVAVDPLLIKRVRSQANLALTDYGLTTRLIYSYLRKAAGRPCNATEVAAFIAEQLEMNCDQSVFSDFRYRIRKRMQHLAWEGKISRVENQVGSIEGRWCLKPSHELSSALETPPLDDDLASNPSTNETDPSQIFAP